MDIREIAAYLVRDKRPDDTILKLKTATKFLSGDIKLLVDFNIDSYNQRGIFVSWGELRSRFLWEEVSPPVVPDKIWDDFCKMAELFELEHYQQLLVNTVELSEKRNLVTTIGNLLLSGNDKSFELKTSKQIGEDERNREDESEGLVFNIRELNESYGRLTAGSTMVIIGIPGGGKTTEAINLVHQNSVLDSKRCLYFYLENLPRAYRFQQISRYSKETDTPIPQRSLFQLKYLPDEDKAKIREIEDRFESEKKGEIFYHSMKDMSNDPYMLGRQLSKIVKENAIDYIIIDHIQRFQNFKPTGTSLSEYYNRVGSMFSTLALGDFGNDPIVSIILSQFNRDGEERVIRSKGKGILSDASYVSSLEQDAFLYLHVYMNDSLKQAGEFSYQILKSRIGETREDPVICYTDMVYAFMGDVDGMEDVYTNDSFSNIWDAELEGV